jgi:hypothetical protein
MRRLDVVLVLIGLAIALPAVWFHLRGFPHNPTSNRHA